MATPHPVDIHVGARLRKIRSARRLTQEQLAVHVGVTFQQIQKYERGTNRISASRLFEFSELLGVQVQEFYEGLSANAPSKQLLPSREYEVLARLNDISDQKTRKLIRLLIFRLSAKSN